MANSTYHPRGQLVEGFRPREHPLYVIWADMKARCNNPNLPEYVNYGGRGITVCARWQHFANFVEDMSPRPDDKLTLERLDNSKGYENSNCAWVSRTRQCLNRRVFKNNSTGFTGVVKVGRRFEARVDVGGVRHKIGRFDSAEEAAQKRADFMGKLDV